MSIIFNEICVNEEMLPKYTYIYIYIYKLDLVLNNMDAYQQTPVSCCLYTTIPAYWPVGRVFANSPEGLVSIPGRVIPKTLKMVLDTSLINTQQYPIYPTPPLGQDMTQGQFFKRSF